MRFRARGDHFSPPRERTPPNASRPWSAADDATMTRCRHVLRRPDRTRSESSRMSAPAAFERPHATPSLRRFRSAGLEVQLSRRRACSLVDDPLSMSAQHVRVVLDLSVADADHQCRSSPAPDFTASALRTTSHRRATAERKARRRRSASRPSGEQRDASRESSRVETDLANLYCSFLAHLAHVGFRRLSSAERVCRSSSRCARPNGYQSRPRHTDSQKPIDHTLLKPEPRKPTCASCARSSQVQFATGCLNSELDPAASPALRKRREGIAVAAFRSGVATTNASRSKRRSLEVRRRRDRHVITSARSSRRTTRTSTDI